MNEFASSFQPQKNLRIWQGRELRFNLQAIKNNELICLTFVGNVVVGDLRPDILTLT